MEHSSDKGLDHNLQLVLSTLVQLLTLFPLLVVTAAPVLSIQPALTNVTLAYVAVLDNVSLSPTTLMNVCMVMGGTKFGKDSWASLGSYMFCSLYPNRSLLH